jgi:hypothetical protein
VVLEENPGGALNMWLKGPTMCFPQVEKVKNGELTEVLRFMV